MYFIGLIDILQKFNLVKWLERGFKRQASFLTSNDTWSVGDFKGESAASESFFRFIQPDTGMKSPPPMSPTVWDGAEHSVEEPQRYASRLLDYIRGVLE